MHGLNSGVGAVRRWGSQGGLPGGGWEGLGWKDGHPGQQCAWLGTQPCHYLCLTSVAQSSLTWGSDLGAHSMARGAAAAPPSSEGELRGRPQPAKPLPCLAALCHPAGAGAQFAVAIGAWQPRTKRCSQGTAGGWRAHQPGLGRLRGPAPHLSPSLPG